MESAVFIPFQNKDYAKAAAEFQNKDHTKAAADLPFDLERTSAAFIKQPL